MRAAVITQFNYPWEIKNLPDPVPAEGQVVVKIEASGMCGTDLHVHRGMIPMKLPVVAGHEPVGKVIAVGAGVRHLKFGDHVGVRWIQKGCGRCEYCQRGKTRYCQNPQSWINMGGGNSEYAVAWEDGCTLVPKSLTSVEAAPIFCAGFTVLTGIRSASPKPGERVAVVGIGGLGHLAVQYAKTLGLEVVALTNSIGKKKEIEGFGADSVLSTGSNAGEALSAVGGADVILCTTNSATDVSRSVAGLRPEGRLVNLGTLDAPIQIDSREFYLNQTRLIGSSPFETEHLVDALSFAARGKVKAAIETYPLSKVNEARERLAAGKVRYRAVLVP